MAVWLLLGLLAFAPPTALAAARKHGRTASSVGASKPDREHKRGLQPSSPLAPSPKQAKAKAAKPTLIATAQPAAAEAPRVAKNQNRADRFATHLRSMASRAASPGRTAKLLRLADKIQYLLGYETMDTASLELAVAVTLQIPGWAAIGNLALQVRKWFPSREYRREAVRHGWDEPQWGYAAGPATPWAGSYGYDSVLGWYMPGISKRGYGQGIGIPNFASVGFGHVGATKASEYARGSYVTGTAQVFSVGFIGVALDFSAYYRPAVAVTRYMKPIADKLRGLVKRVASFFTRAPYVPSPDFEPLVRPVPAPTVDPASPRVAAH